MEIKYCKNCANFSPIFNRKELKPEENYSFGFCRVISMLKIIDNKLTIIPQPGIIEKVVAVNQVIMINDQKICPAFSTLADLFNPENFNLNISNLEILRDLKYIKCHNCFHIFASPLEEPESENIYTCPICFTQGNYAKEEHFEIPPRFMTK